MLEWFPLTDVTAPAAGSQTKLDKGNPNEALTDRWAAAGSFKFPPHHPQQQQRVTYEHSQAEHKTQRIKLPHVFSIFYQLNIRNKHQGVFQKSFSIILHNPKTDEENHWERTAGVRGFDIIQDCYHHTAQYLLLLLSVCHCSLFALLSVSNSLSSFSSFSSFSAESCI